MVKKIFTTLAVIFAAWMSAQAVNPDSAFGTNGIYSFTDQTTGNSFIKSLIQPDGKIIVSGQRINGANDSQVYVSRVNANGTLDTSFGINGFYTGYQNSFAYFSNLYYSDNKILIFYPDGGVLVKLNSNGTPDTNFGNNGILTIGETGFGRETVLIGDTLYFTSKNSLHKIKVSTGTFSTIPITLASDITGVYLGLNGNLLLKSINDSTFTNYLTLIDTNGAINTSFGTNGTILTNASQTLNDFENSYDYIAVDEADKIYYGLSNEADLTTIIKKYDENGSLVTTFGTNGAYQYTNNILGDLKILSNKIYLSGANINGADLNLFIGRLNSDGTSDNSFDGDGIFVFDSNSLNEWAESLNIISPLTIIVAGNYEGTTNNTSYVGKFNVTQNLSTTEIQNDKIINFQNPVKTNLIYKTTEKVDTIELYNMEGKLIKILFSNYSNVSELPKGMYTANVVLSNGKTVQKKLIKD